jgi:transcriptional regulator with XRE-family HTH domain
MKGKTVARLPSGSVDPLASVPIASGDDSVEQKTTPATLAALANELRRQRKKNGLSLDDLADASGVSRAMISKIERAQSSPSTSTLSKLANALDTSLSRLVGQEARRDDIVLTRHEQQMVWVDPETGFSRRVLSPILPGRGLDIVLAQLPPKSDSGALVAHTMPVEEYVYVLSGALIVTVGETRTALNASDALYYRADVPHRFENEGRIACTYLLVVNPLRT